MLLSASAQGVSTSSLKVRSSISTSILKGLSSESAVMLLCLPPLKVLVPVA
jgi:hypothetical protein